jgi:hypothetical protein
MAFLNRQFPIALDDSLTRLATITVLLGAALFRVTGWATVGWVAVAFGIVMLWLAHEVAVAPYAEEPPVTWSATSRR